MERPRGVIDVIYQRNGGYRVDAPLLRLRQGDQHDQQRQIDFDKNTVPASSGGMMVIAIIYAGGRGMFFVYVQHIHNVWIEWLTVPPTSSSRMFEWAA